MDEKKWMEKIRDSAEGTEIPKSLEPEEMEKRLKKTKQEKKRFPYYKVSGLAAALLLVVAAAWQVRGIQKDGTVDPETVLSGKTAAQTQESETAAEPRESETAAESQEEAPFHSAESYDEIYERLKEQFGAEKAAGTGALMARDMDSGAVFEADNSTDIMLYSEEDIAEESMLEDTADTLTSGSGDFSETNLQELGVDEGDVVKTDGTYFYIVDEWGSFRIVKAEGSRLELASRTEVPDNSSNFSLAEMYVDGDRLVLIGTAYEVEMDGGEDEDVYWMNEKEITKIYTYDISDREEPELLGQTSLDGSYRTSRKNGGYLYVISEYYPVVKEAREQSVFVPLAGGEEFAAEDIFLPEEFQNSSYLVIVSVDLEKPDQILDRKAFVSGASDYYVSTENIYVAMNEWRGEDGNYTKIMRCSYQDGIITPRAAGAVKGYLNNSFSMNEWNGYLRVVTTQTGEKTRNALYVLNENLKVCGQITDLAEGETIRSARFFGDTGYFVTYRNMDPLFSVDLSDPENPVILGELKITGFSAYLHFYGKERLLGIGYETDPDTGATKGIKLSMFDISDPSDVKEVSKYVIQDAYSCDGMYNYKAILADPDKNLIGLAVDTNYLVFSYEETEGFVNQMTHSLKKSSQDTYVNTWDLRGCYIGDYFYLADMDQIVAFAMKENFAEKGSLAF
ncbi:MAG: beta-propeller domain-containing protein [Candidatus Limivivens sp.]|nr:beta-propeller domain-containing protein [Candidatus Limivivens sp.]